MRVGINDSARWRNEDSLLLDQKQSHCTPHPVFHVAACKQVWLAQEHVAVVYVTSAQASTSLLACYKRAANPICGLTRACIITSLNTSDVSLAQCALEVTAERGVIFDSFLGEAFNKLYIRTKVSFLGCKAFMF